MPETHLGPARIAAIIGLAALTLGTALGGYSRLTYHEAIWAQSAREMNAGGSLLVPTLDGRPWLEKPPLGTWLIAGVGWLIGGVTEAGARAPSAVAAVVLALAVATFAARRFGADVGLWAGYIQVTTAWAVTRGRLAEVDILLAALIAWSLVAFDRVRQGKDGWRSWRWGFFGLLGLTALVKGVGFGAALVGSVVVATLVWDRDWRLCRRLAWPLGWGVAGALALAWPLAVLNRHPAALGLWVTHVADRFAARPEHFASEPWGPYLLAWLGQTLPWTPIALVGARASWRRAWIEPNGGDRLLWAWAVAPAALVSLASVRNAHYLIHALAPWSVWGAIGLASLGERWRRRGWTVGRSGRGAVVGFASLGLAYALGFALLGPKLDVRGTEWIWYRTAARRLEPGTPLVLLYDDWDRLPYPTPFGPMPHDLAVRLFYLDRPACWRSGTDDLIRRPPWTNGLPFAVIARDRDLPELQRLGQVESISQGPTTRWDRAFTLFRIRPDRNARNH
ncbi:MAG: glycosyltransferase family 39 protein [Isosphaeraceae bacterium]